jgi:hypothetical protein
MQPECLPTSVLINTVDKFATCSKTSLISLGWQISGENYKSKIIALTPTHEVTAETGVYGSVDADGRPDSVCVITRRSGDGDAEIVRRELLFADGLVKFTLPRELWLGYDVAVARNCLVMAGHYTYRKDGSPDHSKTSVAAIRITRSGRCQS